MGVMEVSQVLEDESGFEKQDTQGTRILFEKKASSADQALEILQEYAPEKTSLLSSLEGKALIEKEKYAESISKKEDIMDVVSDLIGWQKEIAGPAFHLYNNGKHRATHVPHPLPDSA